MTDSSVLRDQANSLRSRSCQRMGHCLSVEPVLLVPVTGPAVQLRDQRRGCLLQPLAQHLGNQAMVAIPLPFVIEGNQEEIGPLQSVELCLTVVLCSHGIAQR